VTEQEKKVDTIVVNGRPREWYENEISFEQVVALAYPDPPQGRNIEYTVSYRRAHGNKPEGTLKVGESVKVKDGMFFDVTATDLS
jgi:transcription antitermination factor NusG